MCKLLLIPIQRLVTLPAKVVRLLVFELMFHFSVSYFTTLHACLVDLGDQLRVEQYVVCEKPFLSDDKAYPV